MITPIFATDRIAISLIIYFIILCIAFFILVWVVKTSKEYRDFVTQNSQALQAIRKINDEFAFYDAKTVVLSHRYDNEKMYNEISCRDYLVYELANKRSYIEKTITQIKKNANLFKEYNEKIKNECHFGEFGSLVPLKDTKRLLSIEKRMFANEVKKPNTDSDVYVELFRVDLNGNYFNSKKEHFDFYVVKKIEHQIDNKRGSFYCDEEVWRSICRVERGKVSNKMRFAIYERDGNRCKKCGRETGDLEIDHIIPIAKGGKSEFNNLQTLCHRCNKEKGSKLDW